MLKVDKRYPPELNHPGQMVSLTQAIPVTFLFIIPRARQLKPKVIGTS
jgi:hypothetical protein